MCVMCHEKFNDLYTNVNTLEQFIEFREFFKIKKNRKLSYLELQAYKIAVYENSKKKNPTIPNQTSITQSIVSDKEKKAKGSQPKTPVNSQLAIIESFETLKMKLWNEMVALEKKYGREKGIQIEFRGKKTTSLSTIAKLLKEVMRINTLIACNKILDKRIMAIKFHMNHDEFCKKLQDPTQYLTFTDSEITHLNMIQRNDYPEETKARLAEINKKNANVVRR